MTNLVADSEFFPRTLSNRFRVKDLSEFKVWCEKRSIEFSASDSERKEGPVDNITATQLVLGHWPFCDEDDTEIDFPAELATHLALGDVAILMEIGLDKRCYLAGSATAIHPDGRTISMALSDIYAMAREAFGPDVTITEATSDY